MSKKISTRSWYNEVATSSFRLNKFLMTAVEKNNSITCEFFGIDEPSGKGTDGKPNGKCTYKDVREALDKVWKCWIKDGDKSKLGVPVKVCGGKDTNVYKITELELCDESFVAELEKCMNNKSYKEAIRRENERDTFCKFDEICGYEPLSIENAKQRMQNFEDDKKAKFDAKPEEKLKKLALALLEDGADTDSIIAEIKAIGEEVKKSIEDKAKKEAEKSRK